MSETPRISLDVGAPGAGSAGAGADPGGRREADPGAADAFRRSLAGEAAGAAGGDGVPPAAALANPFALFSTLASAAAQTAAAAPQDSGARTQELAEAVERVLVSDGAGSGEREVRVRLKDDLLPGTEVRIVQREGRLEIAFVSIDPQTLAWLAAQSELMARELARRLQREVRIAVRDEKAREGENVAQSGAEHALDTPPAGPAALLGALAARREGESR